MRNTKDHKKRRLRLFFTIFFCLVPLFCLTSCGRLPTPDELIGNFQEITGLTLETTGADITAAETKTAEAIAAETTAAANIKEAITEEANTKADTAAETNSGEPSKDGTEPAAGTPGGAMAPPSDPESFSAPDPFHIPHEAERFYISNLDPVLKKDFLALYQSVMDFEPYCSLPEYITPEQADFLFMVLRFDCPEVFQIDDSNGYTLYTLYNKVGRISFPYSMDKDEYLEKYKQCRAEVQNYVRQMEGMSDFEKERFVYDSLAASITYSMDGLHSQDAYGALLQHKAKCDGISLAIKWIMEESGIMSMLITGRSPYEDASHAWNCLKLEGAYYDLDLTNDTRAEDGSRTVNLYGAYNVDRSWIDSVYPVSGIVMDDFDLPETQKGRSFHELNGSFVPGGSDLRARVWEALDRAYESSGTGYLQFAAYEDYKKFLNNYDDYVRSWFEEHRRSGAFDMNAIDEFRTAALLIRPQS